MKTFPYAFARISAMKAKLVKIDDYHKLLKMDLASITRYLQESQYKQQITKMSAEYSGVELVDRALRKNEEETYNKLRRICPDSVVAVIDLYLKRYDFQNLKVVLRGIYSNASKEEVASLLEPIGHFDSRHFEELFETGSVLKALKDSKIATEKDIKPAYDMFKEENRLIELENALDRIYYTEAIAGAQGLSVYGKAFKEFLLRDIDLVNIRNLLRFRQESVDTKTSLDYMIVEGLRLNRKKLKSLAAKETMETLLNALKRTFYGKVVKFEGDITSIELQLKRYHMKRAFLRTNESRLSIIGILSYLMHKMIEIDNLRSIVKAKHLGIEPEYVEKNLLVI